MATPRTMIGGDDVRAVVADCGSWALRFGSAGDDSPRAVIPTAVGLRPPGTASPAPAATAVPASPPPAAPVAGDVVVSAPHLFRDIHPVYTHDIATGDAQIRSWDDMLTVWRASYSSLHLNPADGPLVIVEPTRMWRDVDRAAALQTAFESLQVPAAYVARGSAMAAFASARTTACVLDVGAQGATAVPVIDGYALAHPTRRGVVGGAFFSERVREWVESCLEVRPGYDGRERPPGKRMRGDQGRKEQLLRAPHELKRERVSSDDTFRKYVVSDLSSDKYAEGHREFYRLRVVDDLKAGIMELTESKPDESAGKDAPARPNTPGASAGAQKGKLADGAPKNDDKDDKEGKDKAKDKNVAAGDNRSEYTLPDGNVLSMNERDGHTLANCFFESHSDSDMHSLTDLVFNCVSATDIDMRRELFGSIIVTGGSSLVGGVVERFTRELAVLLPQAYKLKVNAAVNATERTCGTWIGGSIIASLGTFQQVWVSKAEYDELGGHVALRKCP